MSESARNTTGRGNVIVGAGAGDTAFVDYHDLHPTNTTAAGIGGALGGGLLGAFGLAMAHSLQEPNGRPRFKLGLLASTAIVAIPAAVGMMTGILQAQTHNQWSDRVLDHMEKTKSASIG